MSLEKFRNLIQDKKTSPEQKNCERLQKFSMNHSESPVFSRDYHSSSSFFIFIKYHPLKGMGFEIAEKNNFSEEKNFSI